MELRFMVTCVLKDLNTLYLLKAFAVFNNAPFSFKAPHVIVVLSNLYSGDLNDRVPRLFVYFSFFISLTLQIELNRKIFPYESLKRSRLGYHQFSL